MAGKFMERAANRDYSVTWTEEGTFPWMAQQKKPAITGRPVSVRDNYIRCVKGDKPFWMPAYGYESNTIWPDTVEEHPVPERDGYDWWGVYWTMVDKVGGMITKPGTRVINDFEHWDQEIEWPDISVVDFKTDGAKIASNLDPDRPHIYECTEGLTERLHEMMPFDEFLLTFYEYPDELEAFLQKMADYKIETCREIFKYYGQVDGVLYHDDWGTQRAGFYSNDMFDEQIMPATKRFFDYLKGEGKFIELHSCGKNIQYVPEMIEMGVDMWTPQQNVNEPEELYTKYGDKMTFTFALPLKPDMTEAETRKAVRDFVDHYGATGRVMAWIMAFGDQGVIARDELYHYSYEFYNKLYGRK